MGAVALALRAACSTGTGPAAILVGWALASCGCGAIRHGVLHAAQCLKEG